MKRNIKINKAASRRTFSLSTSFDDGEILQQAKTNDHFQEYVVQSAITDIPFEEYVIDRDFEPIKDIANAGKPATDVKPAETAPATKDATTDQDKLKLLDSIQPMNAAAAAP